MQELLAMLADAQTPDDFIAVARRANEVLDREQLWDFADIAATYAMGRGIPVATVVVNDPDPEPPFLVAMDGGEAMMKMVRGREALDKGRATQQGRARKLLEHAAMIRASDAGLRSSMDVAQALFDSDEDEYAEYEPSYREIDQQDHEAVKKAERAYLAALARRVRRAEQKAREKK